MSDRQRRSSTDAEQANALACLIEAADRGDGGAACRLGDIYREEVVGLDGSSKRAFHWYSRSALAGDAWGQNNLGACYEHGLGCVQSYPKAVKWYRLAEAQGHGTASMNLGYCYLRGHGVPGDKLEALRLFRLAVLRGEDRATKEVERLSGDRDIARAERDKQRSSGKDGRPRIRYVNATEEGKHFGLVGVAGVAPPAAQKYAEHMDRVAKT